MWLSCAFWRPLLHKCLVRFCRCACKPMLCDCSHVKHSCRGYQCSIAIARFNMFPILSGLGKAHEQPTALDLMSHPSVGGGRAEGSCFPPLSPCPASLCFIGWHVAIILYVHIASLVDLLCLLITFTVAIFPFTVHNACCSRGCQIMTGSTKWMDTWLTVCP